MDTTTVLKRVGIRTTYFGIKYAELKYDQMNAIQFLHFEENPSKWITYMEVTRNRWNGEKAFVKIREPVTFKNKHDDYSEFKYFDIVYVIRHLTNPNLRNSFIHKYYPNQGEEINLDNILPLAWRGHGHTTAAFSIKKVRDSLRISQHDGGDRQKNGKSAYHGGGLFVARQPSLPPPPPPSSLLLSGGAGGADVDDSSGGSFQVRRKTKSSEIIDEGLGGHNAGGGHQPKGKKAKQVQEEESGSDDNELGDILSKFSDDEQDPSSSTHAKERTSELVLEKEDEDPEESFMKDIERTFGHRSFDTTTFPFESDVVGGGGGASRHHGEHQGQATTTTRPRRSDNWTFNKERALSTELRAPSSYNRGEGLIRSQVLRLFVAFIAPRNWRVCYGELCNLSINMADCVLSYDDMMAILLRMAILLQWYDIASKDESLRGKRLNVREGMIMQTTLQLARQNHAKGARLEEHALVQGAMDELMDEGSSLGMPLFCQHYNFIRKRNVSISADGKTTSPIIAGRGSSYKYFFKLNLTDPAAELRDEVSKIQAGI